MGLYVISSSDAAGPEARPFAWNLPKEFPKPRVPANNAMNGSKVEVGRRLFYDKRLSGNGTQSCGSCHQQDLAFTDGRAQAVGSTGQVHPRGSPSLVNVVYNATLTWANPSLVTLERQMEVPLFGTQPVELGLTDANKGRVLARIKNDPWYAKRFRRAFPTLSKPISWTTIVRSISAFQRSIISANSRYDRYLRGTTKLTGSERRGLNLFMGEQAECHHCHGTFIFSDQATYAGAPDEQPLFHNTGLYNLGGTGAFPTGNRGVFEITGQGGGHGSLPAPSLRNVELTAPYMHDGSIPTLEAAVDHYAAGGRLITEGPFAGDGRASPYKDPLISGIDLTPARPRGPRRVPEVAHGSLRHDEPAIRRPVRATCRQVAPEPGSDNRFGDGRGGFRTCDLSRVKRRTNQASTRQIRRISMETGDLARSRGARPGSRWPNRWAIDPTIGPTRGTEASPGARDRPLTSSDVAVQVTTVVRRPAGSGRCRASCTRRPRRLLGPCPRSALRRLRPW